MKYAAACLLIAAITTFVIAMIAYATTLLKYKKPLSFFDLKLLAKTGNRVAGVAYVAWCAAIAFAILWVVPVIFS